MIISFSATNFRSIKEKQTISLEAKSDLDRKVATIKVANFAKNLVPTLGIYGANAAGKSNVIKILKALEWFVLISNKLDPTDKIGANEFFCFDVNYHQEPTTFEIDFIAKNGIRYRFLVSFTQNEVVREELYQSTNPKKETWQNLYVREKGKSIIFQDILKGPKKQIEDLLLENQLFLSKSANNNNEQLKSVFEFFKESLYVTALNDNYDEFQIRMLANIIAENHTYLAILNNVIRGIDVGILEVNIENAKLPQGLVEFGEKVKDEDRKRFLEMMKYELKTIHRLFDGEKEIGTYPLPLKEASEGTQKFITLFAQMMMILKSGNILVIDELDKSFHPLLTKFILDLFHNPQMNPNKAQLIFTTHDVSLLDILDKDQFCKVQKNAKGETQIQRLSEQKGLRNDIPLEKWYMEGRFNATPNIMKGAIQHVVKEMLTQDVTN